MVKQGVPEKNLQNVVQSFRRIGSVTNFLYERKNTGGVEAQFLQKYDRYTGRIRALSVKYSFFQKWQELLF